MVQVFRIALDSPDVYIGGTVAGQVLLETAPKERIKARSVTLSFEGKEKVRLKRTRRVGESTKTVYYNAQRVLVDTSVVLFGGPEGSSGEPVFLEPGRQYAFPFSFDIPGHCLPSCQYSDVKTIRYELKCCVDRPWRFDDTCNTPVLVQPNTHVNLAPPNYRTELEEFLTPTACCCFAKGSLRLKLTLGKAAFWWKESVPVEVVVDNSQCKAAINKVQVGLRVVSTFRAEGHDDTHKHDLVEHEFPLSGASIAPHAHELKFQHTLDERQFRCDQRFPTSTIHGEVIHHKFVVRLVAKYGFGKYSLELPIFVADGPHRTLNPNQSIGGGGVVAVDKPAIVDDDDPVKDPGSHPGYPSQDSGSHPDHPSQDSGQMFTPDNDAPMYERTQYDRDDGGDDAPMYERTQYERTQYGGGKKHR